MACSLFVPNHGFIKSLDQLSIQNSPTFCKLKEVSDISVEAYFRMSQKRSREPVRVRTFGLVDVKIDVEIIKTVYFGTETNLFVGLDMYYHGTAISIVHG